MNSNGDIQEWTRLLALPQLMQKLGYREHAKRRARCPFHRPDRKPSFSVFEIDGNWFWKCHADCGEGDEIDFIENALSLSNGDATRTACWRNVGHLEPHRYAPLEIKSEKLTQSFLGRWDGDRTGDRKMLSNTGVVTAE